MLPLAPGPILVFEYIGGAGRVRRIVWVVTFRVISKSPYDSVLSIDRNRIAKPAINSGIGWAEPSLDAPTVYVVILVAIEYKSSTVVCCSNIIEPSTDDSTISADRNRLSEPISGNTFIVKQLCLLSPVTIVIFKDISRAHVVIITGCANNCVICTNRNGTAKIITGIGVGGSQLCLLNPVTIIIFEYICSTGEVVISGCADDGIAGGDGKGKPEPISRMAIAGGNFKRNGTALSEPLIRKDTVVSEVHIRILIAI